MLGEVPQPIKTAEDKIDEIAQYLKDSATLEGANVMDDPMPHLHGLSANDQKLSILMRAVQFQLEVL